LALIRIDNLLSGLYVRHIRSPGSARRKRLSFMAGCLKARCYLPVKYSRMGRLNRTLVAAQEKGQSFPRTSGKCFSAGNDGFARGCHVAQRPASDQQAGRWNVFEVAKFGGR